ncbi:MAG: succinate dehydrogenase cytochrome b subunit [Actinomycetota bacterium]|nr:succinate dehydrogenase cytochrome b subunit [Actinomycetota bacterium]
MSTTRRTPVESGQEPLRAPAPTPPRRRVWLLELYRSALGKKYVMAVTGIVLMAYVLAHMVGNLKIYLGRSELNQYAEWLRDMGYPALPHSALLWTVRTVLLISFVLHIHAAYALTVMNRRARPVGYQSKRDYVAASFAARTMRWTGVIVGLFVVFHLMDLTWGSANPQFIKADVYHNVVTSFQRWPVALVYVVANIALGYHLFHGAWSLFQSLGWNQRRFNHWRRYFAVAFATVIVVGNVSFPIAVVTGIVA